MNYLFCFFKFQNFFFVFPLSASHETVKLKYVRREAHVGLEEQYFRPVKFSWENSK